MSQTALATFLAKAFIAPIVTVAATEWFHQQHEVPVEQHLSKADLLRLQPPRTYVAASEGVAQLDADRPGRCRMSYPHSGELGYVWPDGRCHHLPR
jgi:hypothetical protein